MGDWRTNTSGHQDRENDTLRYRLENTTAAKEHQYYQLEQQVLHERDRAHRALMAKFNIEETAERALQSAMDRIADLQAQIDEMGARSRHGSAPYRQEMDRALAERDMLRERLMDVLGDAHQSRHGRRGDPRALSTGYEELRAHYDRLRHELAETRRDKATNQAVMQRHLDEASRENAKLKIERDMLFQEREATESQMAHLAQIKRKLQGEIDRFRATKEDFERRAYSERNYQELTRCRAALNRAQDDMDRVEQEKAALERQFMAEYEARKNLERGRAARGDVPPEVMHKIDEMAVELQKLRQQNREIERSKDEEILALKYRLNAANEDANQVIDTLKQERVRSANYTRPIIYQQAPAPQAPPSPPQPQYVAAPAVETVTPVRYVYVDEDGNSLGPNYIPPAGYGGSSAPAHYSPPPVTVTTAAPAAAPTRALAPVAMVDPSQLAPNTIYVDEQGRPTRVLDGAGYVAPPSAYGPPARGGPPPARPGPGFGGRPGGFGGPQFGGPQFAGAAPPGFGGPYGPPRGSYY